MSKKSLLARGVLTGYGATAAQMFYSFASIPLALSHLTPAEFGMWSAVSALATYLVMAEMGITQAFMRHLFECKDGKDPGRYGRYFTACVASLVGVSLLVFLLGGILAFAAGVWLDIPGDLRSSFVRLMLGQAAISAVYQSVRMISAPFYVHHRQDLGNISQMGLFVVYYVVLHYSFSHGLGIYSMLVSQAAGFFWVIPFGYYHCRRNGYYPARGTWGFPAGPEWRSVWRYSRDQIVIQLAGVVLMGLPQLLITRLIGLDAGALWAVFTRPFAILRQTFIRPFEVGLPMLTDMFVNGNMKGVCKRWGDIAQIVLAISICGYGVAAANTSLFVSLWTGGKLSWPEVNNWMVAIYFIAYATAGLSYGTIGLSTKIGVQRFVPIIQALLTIPLAVVAARWWGMAGLIAACAVPYLVGMTVAGLKYLGGLTGFAPRAFAKRGLVRAFLLMPLAFGIATGCSLLQPLLPGYFGLLLSAGTGFALSLGVAFLAGVETALRAELMAVVMKPFRRFFKAKPTVAT